ncbi:MAG: hypothetical protein Q8K72_03345, partial [Acidimicrobiales bacterium]|nr:hypothetical protein [Acidimicrobiales bacterium]
MSSLPEQPPPDHLSRYDPEPGVAVSTTVLSSGKAAVQEPPADVQAMPAGLDVTDPDPVTLTTTSHTRVNVAVAERSAFMTMVHGSVPAHPATFQRTNADPGRAVAVRVTWVPS